MLHMPMWALAAAIPLAHGASVVTGQSEPPQLNLNKAHIRVYLAQAPNLRFFRDAHLSGTPTIQVNDQGAFVDGNAVCTWPGGAFDRENESNMVLGYALGPAGVGSYQPCPDGFPIVSKWAGFGGAALYVEVFSRKGPVIEVRFRRRSLYLDLRSLPGRPCGEAWSCGRSEGGALTWVWQVSEAEGTRRARRSASQLRREPTFALFLKNAVRCLTSTRAPRCFVAFVQGPVGYTDVAPDAYGMTAQQFTEAAWNRTDSEGRSFAEHLAACFVHGELSDQAGARSTSATLTTEAGWTCDLQKTSRGWRLTRFFQNPDAPGCQLEFCS